MNKKTLLTLFMIAAAAFAVYFFARGLKKEGPPMPPAQTQEMAEEAPVEAKEALEAPEVEIDMEKQRLIGVKTAEAAVRPLVKTIRTTGRVEYDETRLVSVNTKIEGWIERLYIDYEGKPVKKGEPLAELYSPELIAAQEEFLLALKWAGTSNGPENDPLLQAARRKLRLWDISDKQMDKIAETGKPLRTLTVYSPAEGYAAEKMVIEGMKVMAGERLFNIADISSVWVMADIYGYEMPDVKVGQRADITFSYMPGVKIASTVEYIYPSVSTETRTAKARLRASNPGGRLRPGMFADVSLKVDLGKRLSVPEDAVIETGLRQLVYVDKGEGYFEPREIRAGASAGGMREVLSGLKAGQRVASSATFLIDSEAQLKGIIPLGRNEQ